MNGSRSSVGGRHLLWIGAALFVCQSGCHKTPQPKSEAPTAARQDWDRLTERIRRDQELVTNSRAAANATVANYAPQVRFDAGDMGITIADGLSKLPGVISVRDSKTDRPTSRIIHLLGPSVPTREDFALAVKLWSDGPVSAGKLELLHDEYLLQVKMAQIEQIVFARCLIKYHGMRCIYFEDSAHVDLFISSQPTHSDDQAPSVNEASRTRLREVDRDPWLEATQFGYLGEMAEWNSMELMLTGSQHPPMDYEFRVIDRVGKLVKPSSERVLDVEIQSILKHTRCCLLIGDAHELLDNVNGIAGERCEYIQVKSNAWRKTSPLD